MYTFDHDLFLALNFDGGDGLDRAMLAVSGTPLWIPLYLLIFWLVGRRGAVQFNPGMQGQFFPLFILRFRVFVPIK